MRDGLHQARGRLEVAIDLVDRTTAICAGTDDHLLEELTLAGRALAAAARALDLRFEAVAQASDGS